MDKVELLPCPNPWCASSDVLRPEISWGGLYDCHVECQGCGLEGPSFSPVVVNEDGEQTGTQDAEALAIAAWNTRQPAKVDAEVVERVAQAIQDAHAPGHPLNHVALYQAQAAIAALGLEVKP